MAAPRITLEQWRALAAVVEEGGYAKAAEALSKSQSSVTYAIQQLESQLDLKAFRIEGRKATLTPSGELLYRRSRYLLDEAASLEQSAKRLAAGWEAEVRLAVEVIYPTWCLLACLDQLGKESPNTRIELIEAVLAHRTDVLAAGQVDLAILAGIPAGYNGEPLLRMRFVLAAHPDHPLHKVGRALTMRDLRTHRHLLARETSAERTTAPTMQLPQRWTVSNLTTSIEAARSGYGFAWLPEEKIREELQAGTLKPLNLREGSERFTELYLIFSDREHAGRATLRLAEIIRETTASACKRRPPQKGTARS
jgi:DNA-binding transcriptional LysR family regulator